MSSTDILQDVHDRTQMTRVNKVRLFLVHIMAIVCVAYFGMMIATTLSMPTFKSMDEQFRNLKNGTGQLPSLEELKFWNLVITISGYASAFIGGIISYIICRSHKLPIILPISILLYSIIVFWVSSQIPYIAYLFPGGYFLRYLGWNIAPFINGIYLLAIIWFLFFSKRVRNWWLRPVIE